MKRSQFIPLAIALVLAFSFGAWAADYYVVKSADGKVRIVDHKPEGKAEVIEGPFDAKRLAQPAAARAEALKKAEEKGRQAKKAGKDQELYYLVQTEKGEYRIVEKLPTDGAEVISGPFEAKEIARWVKNQIPEEDLEKRKQSRQAKSEERIRQARRQGEKERRAQQGKAEQYYVIETRGGEMRVVDHRPEGRARVVEGPFSSEQQARQAMRRAESDQERRKQARGQGQKEGRAQESKAEQYFVVRTAQGDLGVSDDRPEGKAEVVEGPFKSEQKARQAMRDAQTDKERAEAEKDGEYYVAKGKKGEMKVVDHKPKGQTTAVKGPFDTEAQARQALKKAEHEQQGKEQAAKKGKEEAAAEKQARGRDREKQYSYCLPPEKAKRMESYYVVKDDVGRMTVRSYTGDDPILFGPFRKRGQAVSAMLTGRCAR